MSNTVRNIEISKAEEVGAAIIDEQPQDYSIVQEWADKLGIELPQESAHVTPIKELSALVKGLVRKVLNMFLPQIVNKTEETYSHLDSRCKDYTPAAYASYIPRPYDPMGTPRTLPNLLQAITAFSARKIDVGASQQFPDGVSIPNLILSSINTTITELFDPNNGYTITRNMKNGGVYWKKWFPSLETLHIGAKKIDGGVALCGDRSGNDIPDSVVFDNLEEITGGGAVYLGSSAVGDSYSGTCKNLGFPKLKKINNGSIVNVTYAVGGHGATLGNLEGVTFPVLEEVVNGYVLCGGDSGFNKLPRLEFPALKKLEGGALLIAGNQYGAGFESLEELRADNMTRCSGIFMSCLSGTSRGANSFKKLKKVVIGEGFETNLNMSGWYAAEAVNDAEFLPNFREHIALRLTSNGSGKTLTLSQAVRDAIHAAEATYGIEAIIVTQKGWTLSPAPTA